MLTLTDADRAKLAGLIPDNCTDPLIVAERQAIYRAGIAAGIERAITECDREREIYHLGPPGSLRNDAQQMARSACWGCAAAVRALLK